MLPPSPTKNEVQMEMKNRSKGFNKSGAKGRPSATFTSKGLVVTVQETEPFGQRKEKWAQPFIGRVIKIPSSSFNSLSGSSF